MKTASLLLCLLALLAGCDRREALVEKCVAANVQSGAAEGLARIGCMRAAYGHPAG